MILVRKNIHVFLDITMNDLNNKKHGAINFISFINWEPQQKGTVTKKEILEMFNSFTIHSDNDLNSERAKLCLVSDDVVEHI